MSEIAQKVAIVTGGSQGIGAGIVEGYRQRGWAVVANSLNIGPSKDLDVLTVKDDISEQATADQIISRASDRFGRIDTLVNNAGIGFFWLTQRAISQMLKQHSGHVVNISASVEAGTALPLGGYTIVRAADLEEATRLASGCPILQRGGAVEVGMLTPSPGRQHPARTF